MRAVAIVPAYPPLSRVGAWLSTHRFLSELVACGHHVDVFTTRLGGGVYELDGVAVGPAHNPVAVTTAVAISDVVLCHVGEIEPAATLAEQWNKPNVRMVHGRVSDRRALDGAALLVFNSHSLAASEEHESPFVVCHPPVFADDFRTTPGDRVTLVNLSEAKGGELLWRIARNMTDVKFLAVRGAYGGQHVEEMRNVDVVPTTANMRDDVYARTRILLMPSEHESWGMTAVEAMASGIPVIAHPTPGLVECLGDAGIFVNRDEPEAWLAAIRRLSDPREWLRASCLAFARGAELDPQAELDRFVNSIESLVSMSACAS